MGGAVLRPAEVEGGVDQADVRERLGDVADLPARMRVVLLGEQAHVVAEREEPLEDRARFLAPSLKAEVVGEP